MEETDGSSVPLIDTRRRGRTHDVFISFRGMDTRKSFTSHLYLALFKENIDVFMDARGDKIPESIAEGIKGSKISLVVLSENFAFSSWCLEELVLILECKKSMGQVVIPIFYDVHPSDVRLQRQSFARAFAEHEQRNRDHLEKVEVWRSALRQVAELAGWYSSDFTLDSELINEVVGDTIRKLRYKLYRPNLDSPRAVFAGLVGIDSHVERIMSLLDTGAQDFFNVGIYGTDGIGKTTLAEAVFHQIKDDFEGSYFLRNVRKTEEKGGDLVKMRDKIISEVSGEEKIGIGTSMLPRFAVDSLRHKRVLVVLDDVNDPRQLEILSKGLDEFRAGSRVIITTPDEHMLGFFPKDKMKAYRVKRLSDDEAMQLFRQNAYIPSHQIEAYDELAERVVRYASGVPLVLKILASSLRGKDKRGWESALSELGRVPNTQIGNILKISYDTLEDENIQNIFLDIACFLEGRDRDEVTRVLNGCYDSVSHGISVLEEKSLLTLRSNKIEMHPLVHDFGRSIRRNSVRRRVTGRPPSTASIAQDVRIAVSEASPITNDASDHDSTLATMEWASVILNIILEIPTAVFEQISSVHKPVYALMSLVISIVTLFLCVIGLIYKGCTEKVRWRWTWPLPWFYYLSPSTKRFGSFADIVGFACSFFQYLLTVINYSYIHHGANSPIKISLWPIVFALFVLLCKLLEKPKKISIL